MKNYFLLVLFAMVTMNIVGCQTHRKHMAEQRDKLDNKEPWRYQIPAPDATPTRPLFPHVKRSTLNNGLQIIVVEDHRLPIAQLGVVFKVGSASDPLNYGGLTYLSAQMLKEGAGHLDSLEFAESLANLGTEVGVLVSKDMTHISAEVLANKVDETFALLALMAKSPRLGEADFHRIKRQHQSLIASQSANPSYVAQVSFLSAAYGDKHPYGHPNNGTLKSVANINLKHIKKAIQENFGVNHAAIVAVGDVTLAQIEELAQKHLHAWRKASRAVTKVADPPQKNQLQTRLVERPSAPQTYVLVGQVAARKKDKDLAAIEVFQNIIAGLPTSRLGANLREAKGWTYGVGTQLNPLLAKGPLYITSSVQTPFGADALGEIFKEFAIVQKEAVSDEELARAKEGIMHSFSGRFSTLTQVATTLADRFVYTLPDNHDASFYDQIAQVSKEDILAVAQRLLKREHSVAVAVGDLSALEEPVAKMDMGRVVIEHESDHAQP